MQQQQRDLPLNVPSQGYRHQQVQIQGAITIAYSYPSLIDSNQKTLVASLTLIPHNTMPNLPVQVDIRGYFLLQTLASINKSQQLQITESYLFEDEEKIQQKPMMKESVYVERGKNLQKQSEDTKQGEYFLQGCRVLFQLQERSHQRLEQLQAGTVYTYPIEFALPSSLPVSMDHRLLRKTHIAIRYCLEIKISYLKKEKVQNHILTLPFTIQQAPKVYPFQELVLNQKIRCYHSQAKTKDPISNNAIYKLAKCICPKPLLKCLLPNIKTFSTKYSKYDLYHIEVLAVVNKNHTLLLTVRAYKEPDESSLTVNRKKRTLDTLNETNDQVLGQAPPQASNGSIQESQRIPTDLIINKVEVRMMAELSGMEKQIVFTKIVNLSRWNYDMLQGQGMVHLKQYLDYPHSCINELFELRYNFAIRPFFHLEQAGEQLYENFLLEETVKALDL